MTKLTQIQSFLSERQLDGWLLYSFWQQNPIALSVAGLQSGGSRRWFLWIPAEGKPTWLIHAIESNTFVNVAEEMRGEMHSYVSWQDLNEMLPRLIGCDPQRRARILMEYSPGNAIPYVSRIDAGIKEVVEESTGAEILSSAELVQMVEAVLTPEQVAGHRRAAVHCLAIKDAAFEYIAHHLRSQLPLTEYDAQQFIEREFVAAGLYPDHRPIVAVNANAADPHYSPSAERHSPIQRGDVVLIDLWNREQNRADDCYADCTWTAYCGHQVPPKVREVFSVVAAGRDRAVALIQERLATQEAVYGYEVDDVCRAVIEGAGYGSFFFHRTGHSLGPTGHFIGVNMDNLETRDRRPLIPGVLFTIEPGIYMPDFNFDDSAVPKGLGIRSEINCFVHADRVEVTTLPIQTEVSALLADSGE